jgi:hypothetical protein
MGIVWKSRGREHPLVGRLKLLISTDSEDGSLDISFVCVIGSVVACKRFR